MNIELSSQIIAVRELSSMLENPYDFKVSTSDLAISLPNCFCLMQDSNISTTYTRCKTCSAFINDQLTTSNDKCKICSKVEDALQMQNSVPNDVQRLTVTSISQSSLQSNSNTNLNIIALDSSLIINGENIPAFLTKCFSTTVRSSDLFAIVFLDRCLRIPRLTITESSSPIEIDIFDIKAGKTVIIKRLVAQGLYFVNLDRILDLLPRLHEITTAIQNSQQTTTAPNNNTALFADGFVQLLNVTMDTMQAAVSSATVTVITGRTMLTTSTRQQQLPAKMTMNAILIGQRQIDTAWLERVTRRSGGMIVTAETLTESNVQATFTALLSPPLPCKSPLQSVEVEVLCSEGLRLVSLSGAEILQGDSTTLAEMVTPIKKHYKSYKYALQLSRRGSIGLSLLFRAVKKQSTASKFSSSARKLFNGSAFTSSPSSNSNNADDTSVLPATMQIILNFKGVKQGTGVAQQCSDITKVWTIPLLRSLSFRPLSAPRTWDTKVWIWAVSQAIVMQYEQASLLSNSDNWSSRQNRRKDFLLGIDTLVQNLGQSFMSSQDNRDKMRFVCNLFYGLKEGPLLDGASVSLLESHLLRINFTHNIADINFGFRALRPSLKVLHLSFVTAENMQIQWKEVPADCVHLLPNTIALMDAGDLIVLSFNDVLDSNGEWQGRGINEQSEVIQALWQRLVDDTNALAELRNPAAKVMILPLPSTPNHRLLYSRLAPFPADSVKNLIWKEMIRVHSPMVITDAVWSAVKRRAPITDQVGYAQWLLGLGLGLLLEEEDELDTPMLQPVIPMMPMERGQPPNIMAVSQYTIMQPKGVVASPPPTQQQTSLLEV